MEVAVPLGAKYSAVNRVVPAGSQREPVPFNSPTAQREDERISVNKLLGKRTADIRYCAAAGR